ncbi:MAG: porin [Janthinobacterium lividum]
MQKRIYAGAGLAFSLAAATMGVAHAQSSVTLYGIVDEGITYTNNTKSGSQVQASSGAGSGSRWGLKGREDLGGGYSAIFVLEDGFDVGSGKMLQNGREFGRQAYVGIESPLGRVTLGRQYEPVFDYVGASDISAILFSGNAASHAGDVDNADGTFRVNNSVKYVTPNFAGFTAEGLFAPGGTAGNFGSNRTYGFGAGYAAGPISLGAAYTNINNPAITVYDGTTTPGTAAYTSPITSPIYSGYAAAHSLAIFAAGGSYQFGGAIASLSYSRTAFNDVLASKNNRFSGDAVLQNIEGSLRYQFSSAWSTGVSYTYTKAESAKYSQLNTGVDYAFSKRTDTYAFLFYQHASGIDSTGARAVAAINTQSASATPNQLALRVGLRHRF